MVTYLTVKSMRIGNIQKLGILCFGFFIFSPFLLLAQDLVIEKIIDHGNDESRLVLVVLGDGYREGEIGKYRQDVDKLLQGFFSVTPWAEYKRYINVYRIELISNQSGADHPSEGVSVDTALDASYYPPADLLVSSYKANNIAQQVSGYDYILVVVNDAVYGASGRGKEVVVSTHSSQVELALHEFGHTFAHLADEYEQSLGGAGVMNGPNVTSETERDKIPWKIWIETGIPIPTPEESVYSGVVGLFEGAAYQSTDIYRPRLNCRMRNLGVPFCQICIQAQILKFYAYTKVIEEVSPSPSAVLYEGKDYLSFNLTLIDKNLPGLHINWEVDGITQQEGGLEFRLGNTYFDGGQHSVKATVKDNTPMVRYDPNGILISDHTWILKETNNPPQVPSNPFPPDRAVNQPLTGLLLSWQGGDPDPVDTLTYDLYFDQNNPPSTLVSANQAGTSYLIGGGIIPIPTPIPNPVFIPSLTDGSDGRLSPEAIYYWKIMAKDNFGGQSGSPIWRFTTMALPQPVTRKDIDKKIKDLKEGITSEPEVKTKIEKYLAGQ